MLTKECGVCNDKAMLVDAGFNHEAGAFASQYECQNGHMEGVQK